MTLPISCACCGPGKDIHREKGRTLSLWVKERGFRCFYAAFMLKYFFLFLLIQLYVFFWERKNETELKIFGFRNDSGRPRCCTCSWDTSVSKVMDARGSYLCQDNELLVYHMCEMHWRNVTPVRACVCMHACMHWERPCVHTLSIVFTASRAPICPELQSVLCVLLRSVAGIGFGCISSPSFHSLELLFLLRVCSAQ